MATDFFRSSRLVYRAITPPPKDSSASSSLVSSKYAPPNDPLAILFNSLAYDASTINWSPALWDPPEGTNYVANMHRFSTTNKLLKVYICLPVPANTPGAVADPAISSEVLEATDGKSSDHATHLIPIGVTTISAPPQPTERFAQHRKGEISIAITTPYQGKGYGGEAVRWVTDWGFRFAGLHRIEIACGSWNERAARLYEKIGFVREGVKRKSRWVAGSWRDLIEMGMLEEEFWKLDWVKNDIRLETDETLAKLIGSA